MDVHIDKVVVITGASSGIGEATAKLLASKGAKLVLGARRLDRLEKITRDIKKENGSAVFKTCNVTDRSQVSSLIELGVTEYGRVDVLVNNAGVMPVSFLSQRKVEEWEQMVDVNIKGVLYGIAAVIAQMKDQGYGQIINISSIAGHTVYPSAGVYAATKHAVHAISEALRQEEKCIRSTVISPGMVKTELTNTISDDRLAAATNSFYEDAISPESIAGCICWAIEQPPEVEVNDIVVRPVVQKQ